MNIIEIENNGVKYCGIVINEHGCEILCYGDNKLFIIVDNTSDSYYDEKTDSMIQGELHFGGILVDYCIIPEYDKFLNEIK